ncbi:3-hydroxy acid dehydrogenase / malonic semialdehyde reductase [Pseudomonas sp. URIL14HWK12:I8]|uniref:SDR family NAD(P)-dependent oxidoreductase n=1 Tax=unclassified Pseudomonas TaxID=196821 RepID=UPI000480E948|nr:MULTISPECIES: SDR family NAD(P)-dependent oxidoreductase [unclassified Pseudomonas]SNB62868.1 3-hydroxy acid dehydrogenase / malonic semialdehyde reductase [Pseudomonas sp. URIL14HWK12:I8]
MTVLVTGASSGFGKAIAQRLVNDGHRVVGIARRLERLEQLADQLGERFYPVALDITDREAVAALPGRLPAEFATLDVLVNNAGLALGLERAQDADLNDWRAMIDTNIIGLTELTHAVLPGMVARNKGTIINLGSVAGTYPYAGGNVYGASKAFVQQFSLNLRADLAHTALRVTNLEPGLVGGTEFTTVRLRGDASEAAKRYDNVTALTADDIAEAVAWIIQLPAHVNINRIEVMPVAQSFAPLAIHRAPA